MACCHFADDWCSECGPTANKRMVSELIKLRSDNKWLTLQLEWILSNSKSVIERNSREFNIDYSLSEFRRMLCSVRDVSWLALNPPKIIEEPNED